jgi:MSHA pilin protein MshC
MTVNRSPQEVMPWQASRGVRQLGFTLIELIMVMVILGVLSIYAAPRMFNTGDFYARGFHDETLALLRYAQKTAIAQRRTVCAGFTTTTITLTIAATAATSDCASNPLAGPKGDTPGTITARSGVTYSSAPATLSFDGLGQPTATQLSVQVANAGVAISQTVTIEPVTGYVHD